MDTAHEDLAEAIRHEQEMLEAGHTPVYPRGDERTALSHILFIHGMAQSLYEDGMDEEDRVEVAGFIERSVSQLSTLLGFPALSFHAPARGKK